MDPDGRVEQNVVTQLLEQQDAILQVAKVSGKGQNNVQDGPRHVNLGRLEHSVGGGNSINFIDKEPQKVNNMLYKKMKQRMHAEREEEELPFCLTSTQTRCDLQKQPGEKRVCLISSVTLGVCMLVYVQQNGINISLISERGSLQEQLLDWEDGSLVYSSGS